MSIFYNPPQPQTPTKIAAVLPAPNATRTQTQIGVARITASTTQTRVGISRIQTTVTQNQVGKARIQVTSGTSPNYASSSLGSVAAASSTVSSAYSPQYANDGFRGTWGVDGGWNSTGNPTVGAPEWLEIDFGQTRTINEIDTFTYPDSGGTAKPAPTDLATVEGILDFQVQYWNGSSYVTIQTYTSNSLAWIKTTFAPVSTSKIRIYITAARDSFARILELEAYYNPVIIGKAAITGRSTSTQVGVARIKATTTRTQIGVTRINKSVTQPISGKARIQKTGQTGVGYAIPFSFGFSSESSEFSGSYSSDNAFGGFSTRTWMSSGSPSVGSPQWLEFDFVNAQTIDTIDVFSLDDSSSAGRPTSFEDTFTLYGVRDFQVQYWNGSSWTTIQSYTGNNKLWVRTTFSPVTTTSVRINVTGTPYFAAEIHQVEIFGPIVGKSKITASTTRTQTGVSRITAHTTKTQIGVARIQKASIQTQIGVAKLQARTTQTQIGLSRITASTQRTQLGVARLQKTATQTQVGVSRIIVVSTKTQVGVSRVQKTVTQTQAGVSRVSTPTLRTVAGLSRITAHTTRTQTGVANIKATTTRTQLGVGRVTASTSRTTIGLARVQKTATSTQVGISRLQKSSTQTQIGLSRITATTPRTQAGLSRVTKSATATQIGVARIRVTVVRTQVGVSRVTVSTTRTQVGVSNIISPYTRQAFGVLPTTNTTLATNYTPQEVLDATTADGVYVALTGSGFLVHEFKKKSVNNTLNISVSVELKTSLAPTSSTVYLQIFNVNTSSWETLSSNSVAPANTNFILSASKSTSVANYYETDYTVTLRVYQEVI